MYKKYMFPMQIFLILEKTNFNLFTSKKQNFNFYTIFFDKKWNLAFNSILKNELFLNSSSLIENSAIDLNFYNNLNEKFFFFFKKYKKMIFYNYYIYNTKIRLLTCFFLNSFSNLNRFNSIDNFFFNASWLERETSEMYGIYFNNKKDHRKLLLDYSIFENPLLKDFPVEGTKQVFFSFFENQVIVQNKIKIEL